MKAAALRRSTTIGSILSQSAGTTRSVCFPQAGKGMTLAEALASSKFVTELTIRVAAFARDPDTVVSMTLARLDDPKVGGRFDPSKGDPLAFALGIARRVAMECDRQGRQTVHLAEVTESIRDQSSNPLEQLVMVEEREQASKILALLSEGDRDIVMRWARSGNSALTPGERRRRVRVLKRLKKRFGIE